ncbi:hypothetical protein INR49_008499 [Caranx melampygus]|nr:hypothetical protein INR49_008499 [Caranx melampygus]
MRQSASISRRCSSTSAAGQRLVYWWLEASDVFHRHVLPVSRLQEVVAEVEDVKASLLSQQGDDHAAGPVEAVSEALPGKQTRGVSALLHSLYCELMGSNGDAVHKLHGTPETVELHTLVHVHHAIAGQRSTPDGVVQEASHASEDDLKHGQTTAQPLFGQKVALSSNGYLLKER